MVLEGGPRPEGTPAEGANEEALRKLQLQIQQRDNEINILVGMLKKKRPGQAETCTQTGANPDDDISSSVTVQAGVYSEAVKGGDPRETLLPSQQGKRLLAATEDQAEAIPAAEPVPIEVLSNMEVLKDRNKAFEAFRKSYRKNEAIEAQKQTLREKYSMAKATGEAVNAARAKIQSIKARIEQRRVELDMQNGGEEVEDVDPVEQQLRGDLEEEKRKYKTNFEALKQLKAEIEHIQHLMEGARVRLQHDFEQWFAAKAGQVKHEIALEKRSQQSSSTSAPQQQATAASIHTVELGQPQGFVSTGDKAADADIAAFYKAREELMKSSGKA